MQSYKKKSGKSKKRLDLRFYKIIKHEKCHFCGIFRRFQAHQSVKSILFLVVGESHVFHVSDVLSNRVSHNR